MTIKCKESFQHGILTAAQYILEECSINIIGNIRHKDAFNVLNYEFIEWLADACCHSIYNDLVSESTIEKLVDEH